MSRSPSPWSRLNHLYQKEIWLPVHLNDRSPRGYFYAFLRVVSITLTGLHETRVTSRAAALSFSTLLGLGPLIGMAVLIAGFAVGSKDPDLVAQQLNQLIQFVAPQLVNYEHLQEDANRHPQSPASTPNAELKAAPDPGQVHANPELVNLINNFIKATRSGTGGVVSIFSLILIVLLLFTSVEHVFNDIWGVRRGRSWLTRIVFYWTVLSLGAVVFFGAVGALAGATLMGFFKQHLPNELVGLITIAIPAMSLALLVGILTVFYKFIPNTHVFWRSAFIGALIVVVLLVLNNFLAFAYLSRVTLTKNLYGSLAMPLILMFGLYIFWLFVLVGGQISYAVQNVHFRNSQAAWSNLSASTREYLTLVVLLTICRRFQSCLPPCTVSQLGGTIKVPTQILNECLNRLVDLNFVTPVPPKEDTSSADYLYQPSRPLNRMTLGEFKQLFEDLGDDPAAEALGKLDPIIIRYQQVMDEATRQDVFSKPLDQILSAHGFEESQPPFTFGEKTSAS